MGKTQLIAMTEEQVKTCIENLVQIMRLKPLKLIHDGEVSPDPAEITKYNLREAGDYADKYQLFESPDEFYFLIIYAKKFSQSYILNCDWFDHIFKPFVYGVSHPKVYLCINIELSEKEYNSIPMGILKCPYRFVVLPDLYPVIGSEGGLKASVISYERIDREELMKDNTIEIVSNEHGEHPKTFSHKFFPKIQAGDVGVKLVNALPGELIRVRIILNDNFSPYTEYQIREVESHRESISFMDPSGLCMM